MPQAKSAATEQKGEVRSDSQPGERVIRAGGKIWNGYGYVLPGQRVAWVGEGEPKVENMSEVIVVR